MKTRLTMAALMLLFSTGAFAGTVTAEVSIFGTRFQVGSDARSTYVLSSGATGNLAYIGHAHKLATPNRIQGTYPKGLGMIASSLTNTASIGSTIPLGCNEATVHAQSYDADYPASSAYDSAGFCFSATGLNPYQYYNSAGPTSDDGKESPIILDVTGRGYRLTSMRDGVRFDIRNDGKPIQIAWTAADSGNAFLVLDRNANGTIDNGAELFGSHTPLEAGGTGPTGFHALAELDKNHDYLVDHLDGAWASLLLWTDANHDGQSTADELQPIAKSEITALEIDVRQVGRRDQWGNDFRLMSHARHGDEHRSYFDVWLMTR